MSSLFQTAGRLLRRLWCQTAGATMMEYGLMVALIAIVVVLTIMSGVGVNLQNAFQSVSNSLAR